MYRLAPHRLAFAAALAFVPLAMAQNSTPDCEEGVDWVARTVCAKGIGAVNPRQPQSAARPGAIRAGQMDALRKALELVKGVNINSSTTVANSMVADDQVSSRVNGYVRKFQVGQPHYMDDLTVEVFVKIPLDGIGDDVLPIEVTANPRTTWGPPKEIVARPAEAPAPNVQLQSGVSTGLIVDARGLGVIPALAPRILDPSGEEVYGAAIVSREWAVRYGMAGYAKTPEQARGMTDRIGASPVQIKALRAEGSAKTDLVISALDASDLRTAVQNLKLFNQARVIILVD